MSAVKHAISTYIVAPVATAALLPIFLVSSFYITLSQRLLHSKSAVPLSSQVILITGASSGIGASLAKLYAKESAGVLVLCARRKGELENVARDCRDLGAKEVVVELMDVGEERQVKEVIQRIGEFGLQFTSPRFQWQTWIELPRRNLLP
jgi:NADPH:quinone reductase-like Zn-dependent oxidoreductase